MIMVGHIWSAGQEYAGMWIWKGEAFMTKKNGIAIAIYSFFLVCISIFLLGTGNVTALISLLR